jgi:hypothetical protein
MRTKPFQSFEHSEAFGSIKPNVSHTHWIIAACKVVRREKGRRMGWEEGSKEGWKDSRIVAQSVKGW